MEIRTLKLAHGIHWIADGFSLFRRNPLVWIMLFVIYLVIVIVVSQIPLIGKIAVGMLQQILLGGMLLGCQSLESGGELHIKHLFAGFKQHTKQLLMIVLLIDLCWLTAGLVIILINKLDLLIIPILGKTDPVLGIKPNFAIDVLLTSSMITSLVVLLLGLSMGVAGILASALVLFESMTVLNALRAGFSGCMKNLRAFLAYGLVLIILGIVASIPFGLGWLLLGPTLVGSIYAAYKDIYSEISRYYPYIS